MHEIASLSLYSFSKFSGGACPQIPLEARAFDTRMPSRLLLDPSHLLQNLTSTLYCMYTEYTVIYTVILCTAS